MTHPCQMSLFDSRPFLTPRKVAQNSRGVLIEVSYPNGQVTRYALTWNLWGSYNSLAKIRGEKSAWAYLRPRWLKQNLIVADVRRKGESASARHAAALKRHPGNLTQWRKQALLTKRR